MAIETRFTKGSWAAYDDGVRVSCNFTDRGRAEDIAEKLRRKAAQTKRKCLSCSTVFVSDGPHNRMCDRCRRLTGGLI